MSKMRKKMTTDAGRPVGDNQNSLTVGARGPVVFEDILLFEKMAHFNRERIPERIVHAKGSGAYGYFVCTNPDMPKFTAAKLFSAVGKKTPTFLRFSTVVGNIVASMKSAPLRIQELQVQHFYKADPAYGAGVARGLGLAGAAPLAVLKQKMGS